MQALCVTALILFAVPSAVPAFAPLASQSSQCSGCQGSGSSLGQNSFAGCGFVEVSVTVENGMCSYVAIHGQSGFQCTAIANCSVMIDRQYSGVPAGSIVTGCVSQGSQRYCIDPPLSSNGGAGTPPTIYYSLECGSGQFTWTTVAQCAAAPGGRIAAQASGSCGACPG
jgi:hypothetical protein